MSTADMSKVIEEIMDTTEGRGVKTINFYMMGEPLMNSDTPTFIRMCREAKVSEKLILTTNGSLLKGERAKKLAENPPDFLRVSIYGSTSQHHREVTQSRVPLEDIRKNVSEFASLEKEHSCQIYVKMIDQGTTMNQEFLDLFSGTADEVAIEPVMNWNDPEEGNLAGQSREDLLKKDYFSNKKEICPSPFYVSVIHSDLNVSVCCVDWAKETIVGNLRTSSLKEIWNGDKLKEFQRLHLSKRRDLIKACANCTYIHTFPDNIDELAI